MDYIIREMRSEEYCLLSDFLYEAIYIPEGIEPPPKSVIECPELQEYIVEFGNRKHDKALVAEMQGNVIGAIWVRIMNDYGHIDNDTPSLAMSVYKKYRGLGIGTSLLKQLLQVERLARPFQVLCKFKKLIQDMSFVTLGRADFLMFCPCLYYNAVSRHVKQGWLGQP